MVERSRLPVSNTSNKISLWRDLNQDDFRRHIVDLQRASQEVPADPQVHSASEWQAGRSDELAHRYCLPFGVEQRIADDLAFVAAAEEGPKEISAVALEEQSNPRGLIIRLTANEWVQKSVEDALLEMFRLLDRCASRRLSRHACARSLFDRVVDLNINRLYGRLQSVHWIIPKSRLGKKTRKPLYEGLQKLSLDPRLSQATSMGPSQSLIDRISDLCGSLRAVDRCKRGTSEVKSVLKNAVMTSHDICTSGGALTLEETLSNYGFRCMEASTNKIVRRLDKLGRYWGLCRSLAEDSREFNTLFTNVKLAVLPSYEARSSKIALAPGIRARCLVHAEMQLVTFYGLQANAGISMPRVIGVSKACCYLCNLFITRYRRFFITKSHGQLYERWNFPDLQEYDTQEREIFRRILKAMDEEILATTKLEVRHPGKRPDPMGSWLALPPARFPSQVPSTISSSVEENDRGEPSVLQKQPESLPQSTLQRKASSPASSISTSTADTYGSKCTTRAPPKIPVELLPASNGNDYAISTYSIASWEYPVQRVITASSPCKAVAGAATLFFEIDAPSEGILEMEESSIDKQDASGKAIDLRELRPGEEREFTKGIDEEKIRLVIYQARGQSLHVSLQWK